MRKIHVGDDLGLEKKEKQVEKVNNVDELRERLQTMNVLADVTFSTDVRARVTVRENIGTSLYFSSMTDDIFWLNKHSTRRERKGDSTIYHFSFKG